MSMDLTEPDAGSDLQSVMLKATFDEKENCWRLNGVKRFITNGDADLHLVLARSEEGTKDGRGLSMFIYDKREGGVNVRRIENKLGIHGSPTCELVYKNAVHWRPSPKSIPAAKALQSSSVRHPAVRTK